MNRFSQVDYLAIGHVSFDLTTSGAVAGGTVTYACRAAQALGCRTAMLTSAASDIDLGPMFSGVDIKCVPSKETTTFENIYGPTGRAQTIHALADNLGSNDVPKQWQRARIVHLGPIANEIDPSIIELFSNSLIGLTPQGWFRNWDEDGRVYPGEWPAAESVFSLAGAVILSEEDIPNPGLLDQFRQWTSLLVLTQQAGGCTVFCQGETRHFPAPKVKEANPTGAGDIFATAFFVRLRQTNGNPWESATFANRVAAQSVSRSTIDSKMEAIRDLVAIES